MQKAKISGSSPTISAVVYDRLKGVDFSTDPGVISSERSPYAPNLVSGPGGYPEKRPGWRTAQSLGKAIYGMFSGRIGGEDIYLVHSGDTIYRWWPYDGGKAPEAVRGGVNEHYSRSFVHQERIFILTGREYLVYGSFDGALKMKPVSEIATVPTVVFNSSPLENDGAVLQARNLLTNYRTVGFVGRGGAYGSWEEGGLLYKLPYEKLTSAAVKVRIRDQETLEWEELTEVAASSANGLYFETSVYPFTATREDEEGDEEKYELNTPFYGGRYWRVYSSAGADKFIVNRAYGLIGFAKSPWNNMGAGSDNVEITFEVITEKEKGSDGVETLNKCDTFSVFEERIWLTGNPDKMAFDWHSEADDPAYFPDTGYTRVGSAGTEILGYLQVGTAQAVIKAEGNQDASIYLRTVGTLNDLAAFPIKQGVSGQGAISKRAFSNILDDPLFLTRNGVYAVSSNLVTEQRTLVNRSRFLDPRLTREAHMADAVACSWNGMYLLSMTDGTVYLLDGKQNKVYLENSLTGAGYNYECYHWTNMPATVWMPEGANLFFGTADGRICRLNTDIEGVEKYNDDGKPIKAARATRVEFCGDFLRYKTMVKKGSGLLMQPYSRSSARVYVRSDKAKKELFFEIGLDDYDWSGQETPELYESWKSAQVVPFKKKLKKWKWVQLIVENDRVNEGFGVYGIILRHQKQNLI